MRRMIAAVGVALMASGTGLMAREAQAAGEPVCISHPNFNSTSGLTLSGSAAATGGALRLTPAQGDQSGAAFSTAAFDLTTSLGLDTTFTFRISEPAGIVDGGGETGADGFALLFTSSSSAPSPTAGAGIGYDGAPNSVAIEFDMFSNSGSAPEAGVNDPNGNHVGVHTGGSGANSVNESSAVAGGVATSVPNMSDGATHTARVLYHPPSGATPGLRVFLDNATTPVITLPAFNLASTINLSAGQGFLGFTAATGAAWQNHDILSWTACTAEPTGTTTTTTTVAGATTTTTTAAAGCGGTSTGTITPNAVLPGTTVTYTDTRACFAPNAALSAVYTSDPVSLGTVYADNLGRVSVRLTIPQQTLNTSHTITLTGAAAGGGTHRSSATLTVTRTGVLAVTGDMSSRTNVAVGGSLIAVGAALLLYVCHKNRHLFGLR